VIITKGYKRSWFAYRHKQTLSDNSKKKIIVFTFRRLTANILVSQSKRIFCFYKAFTKHFACQRVFLTSVIPFRWALDGYCEINIFLKITENPRFVRFSHKERCNVLLGIVLNTWSWCTKSFRQKKIDTVLGHQNSQTNFCNVQTVTYKQV